MLKNVHKQYMISCKTDQTKAMGHQIYCQKKITSLVKTKYHPLINAKFISIAPSKNLFQKNQSEQPTVGFYNIYTHFKLVNLKIKRPQQCSKIPNFF